MTDYGLMKKTYFETSLWVHTKYCGRDRGGRRAMQSMIVNSQGANAMENRYSENQDKICKVSCHGEKARWGFARYVLEIKNCHEERYQLVQHNYPDLTDREKVYYLINRIKVADLEATVTTIEAHPDYRGDFEASQLLLAEAVRGVTARKRKNRNVSVTQLGRGDRGGGRRDP